MMIVVIADDMTGAAEIAGVALRNGLQTRLLSSEDMEDIGLEGKTTSDVWVYATNTRSSTQEEAAAMMRTIIRQFQGRQVCYFKKTDSALRGHILIELRTIMEETRKRQALLIAQNPSKGRVIRQGVYTINDSPIAQTDFRFDPEFPINSSNVTEILGGGSVLPVEAPLQPGINIADACNQEEIGCQIAKSQSDTLLAGGADCFNSYLKTLPCSTLIVCGSTLSKPIDWGIPTLSMPDDVFHGADAEPWRQQVLETYRHHPSLVLTIGHDEVNRSYAVRLKTILAETVRLLIQECCPKRLIIEGGATAFAILKALGWHHFQVDREISPGVVQLSYRYSDQQGVRSVSVILKPGSYSWNGLFDRQ